MRDLFVARTGLPVVESYGMTEAASQITATALPSGPHRPGSVGRPVGTEVRVVDERDVPCATGVVGRVRIRGAGVINGYVDGAAADRFDAAGWLDTADLGALDADGYLYLHGRADDVVNRGGELVHPVEVEEVLLGDPAVVEAVVAGRPHDVLGAVPVALVRTEPDAGQAPWPSCPRASRSGAPASSPRSSGRWRSGWSSGSRSGPPARCGARRCARAWPPNGGSGDPVTASNPPPSRPVVGPLGTVACGRRRRSGAHVPSADVVRVLTFACVIAVHTLSTTHPLDDPRADGLVMLLHFTREAFFVLTAFVLMHRYGTTPPRTGPLWRAAVPAGRRAVRGLDGALHRAADGGLHRRRVGVHATHPERRCGTSR